MDTSSNSFGSGQGEKLSLLQRILIILAKSFHFDAKNRDLSYVTTDELEMILAESRDDITRELVFLVDHNIIETDHDRGFKLW